MRALAQAWRVPACPRAVAWRAVACAAPPCDARACAARRHRDVMHSDRDEAGRRDRFFYGPLSSPRCIAAYLALNSPIIESGQSGPRALLSTLCVVHVRARVCV